MTKPRALPLILALHACNGEDIVLGDRHVVPGPDPVLPVRAPCTSRVTRLASIPDIDPRFLRSDVNNLYAVSSNANGASLWKVPKVGVPVAIVPSVPAIGGIDIVVDDRYDHSTIFYTSNAAVHSIQSDGANYFTAAVGRENIGPVLVHEGSLLWAETQRDPSGALQGLVSAVPLDGGTIETFVITAAERVPRRLVAYDRVVAWIDDAGEIVSIPWPMPFGPQTLVAANAGALHATTEGLYFSVPDAIVHRHLNGGIERVPVKGTSAALVTDDRFIYFFDGEQLAKTAILGGTSAVPIADASPGEALAIDDTCVYFVDRDAGAIMMIHK